MKTRKISIHRTFLICLVLVGLMSSISIGYLWIVSEWSRFEKEATMMRATYLESQKNMLKREVDGALDFVTYMQSQTERRLRDSIRNRVHEAHSMAEHLFDHYHATKSTEEIQEMIRETLRPIRFNKGRGYYFAFATDGIETLFAARPEMEGRNMLQVRGGEGEYVVADMLALTRKQGEGFYTYLWSKPGRSGFFPKIAFVERFEPIDWVIGTGEYIDDVERDIQQECLTWISNIQFGKDGYVFAGQWDGLSLSGPAVGKNMYHAEDINGVKIVQELIKAAKAGGGFVHYVLPKFEGKKNAPKISYAVSVDAWQWYIGAGVYVDEIETEIASMQAALEKRIQTTIRNACLVVLFLLVFILVIVKLLSDKIGNNLQFFTTFFKRASTDAVAIQADTLHFSEFVELADAANRMVEERKRAEDALQYSHQRFFTVLNSIDAGIYVADIGTYEILFMNKHMIETFGRDMTGETCWKSLMGESGPCSHCNHEQLVDSAGKPRGVHVWQGKNPINGRWYINYDRAIEWMDGRLAKLQIATDITHVKKMETELQRAQKFESVSTLAAGIAHDFNNLLMGVQGRASLMMDGLDSASPLMEHLQAIEKHVQSATDLTRQLLGLARGGKYEILPVDINELVSSTTALFGRTRKEVEVRTTFSISKAVVEADRRQLEQVLLNIYINAWQAMPEGGDLHIETTEEVLDVEACSPHQVEPGRFIKISITDTGTGMDEATRQKIFDPFFTTKEKSRGTGLGLASAYGIVKNHRGFITVSSEVGRGSTFILYLPSSDSEAQRESTVETAIVRGSGTILLIDDEEMILDVGRAMLEKLGYRVITAKGGEPASRIVDERGGEIDLVIVDMVMPGMDGGKTFDRIREVVPSMPVILSSGYSLDGEATTLLQKGCNGFIQKPFNISELSQKVWEVLDGAEALQPHHSKGSYKS